MDDIRDGGVLVIRRLDDEMCMSIHYAIAMESETVLFLVVSDDAQEGLEVLLRAKKRFFCIAPQDDMVDGRWSCDAWRSWHGQN
jgi:hypothetical protein